MLKQQFFLGLLIAYASLSLLAAENLAPNPSFEEGEKQSPIGWVSLNPIKTSIDTVTFRSGKRSLAIFRTLSPDNKPIFAGWESEPIKVEEGREYILEGWVRTDKATGNTYLSIAWFQDTKFLDEDISEVIQGDNEWKRLYFVSLPPPQANNLRIRFISFGNAGSAYLDDVSLIAHERREYNINLAPNPSFEEGVEDYTFDWDKEWPENASFLRSSSTAHSGIYSLSIKVSARGSRMAGWKSRYFPVVPGKMYTFSAWAKTQDASGETYLVIAWFNEKGWICNSYHGFFVTGTNDWVRLSVSDVPPKGATFAIPYLRSDDNQGSAWFDDVRLTVSDAEVSEIAVPNSSMEVESDFWQPWLSEGHCREIKVDETVAYDGNRSLMISDASGRVAWQSRGMQLDCNENYQYRLSCRVKTEGKPGGKVLIWIAWFGDKGWIKNTESIPVQVQTEDWFKLSLIARPPDGARRLAIYLGCEDFQGTVWFDKVKMEEMLLPPAERREELKEQLPLEYALADALFLLSSGRVLRNFKETILSGDDCKKILGVLEDYFQKHPEKENPDALRVMGTLYFYAGDFERAWAYLKNLLYQYQTIDIRNDLVFHYAYWAKRGLEEEEKRKRAAEIKANVESIKSKNLENVPQLLEQFALDYWKLNMFKEAREIYLQISRIYKNSLSSWQVPRLEYRIALSYFLEGDYKEASRELNDFLTNNPESPFAQEAEFYLAKSLRLCGEPRKALPYLKVLLNADTSDEFRKKIYGEIGKCYMALRDDPKALDEYKSLFKRKAIPGAIYIGSDKETLGNWIGRYGGFIYILPAAGGAADVTGGQVKVVRFFKSFLSSLFPERYASQTKEEPNQIVYSFYTTDPAEGGRHYSGASFAPMTSHDSARLLEPSSLGHIVDAYWDDRGETHPYDEKGPDILVDIKGIPEGIYKLSLYMREHEVQILDDEGHILALKPRKEEQGREEVPDFYESFLLVGPLDITIHIVKGKSLCALLKGIFLDKLAPPDSAPDIKSNKSDADKEKLEMFNKAKDMYETLRREWEEDPYSFYQHLDKLREAIRLLEEYISYSPDTTESLIARWMLWQCYNQLPDGVLKAEKALKDFLQAYIKYGE